MSDTLLLLLMLVLLSSPVYAILPKQLRIYFILLLSLFFYGSFNIGFLAILFLVIAVSYGSGYAHEQIKNNKLIYWSFIGAILAPLLYYKYILAWFGLWAAAFLPTSSLEFGSMGAVLIPAGLSFYTFQCLGYLIDVRRGYYKPETNLVRFAAFVSFFPQVLAGPIERWPKLSSQLIAVERPSPTMVLDGLILLAYGFFLKLVLADRIAPFVDLIFKEPEAYNGPTVLLGLISFTLQIFADFCGYSLIALGAARLFGIMLTNNFAQPFLATSITDFWQRWHISLTRWVGDYIYKPMALAMFRKGTYHRKFVEYSSLLVTWLVIGIWHGALLNFAVFGFVQCIFLISNGLLKQRLRNINKRLVKLSGWFVTMTLVVISFGLIRAYDMQNYLAVLSNLFSIEGATKLPTGKPELLLSFSLLVMIEYLFNRTSPLKKLLESCYQSVIVRTCAIIVLALLTYFLGHNDTVAFIYFRY